MHLLLHAGDAHPGGLAIGARSQVPVKPRAPILHGHEGAAHDGLRVHDAVRVRVAAHDDKRVAAHDDVRVAAHNEVRVRGCTNDNAGHLLRVVNRLSEIISIERDIY